MSPLERKVGHHFTQIDRPYRDRHVGSIAELHVIPRRDMYSHRDVFNDVPRLTSTAVRNS